jgi:hypothetical protein
MSELYQTERGFDRLEFTDKYGAECSLQKSSAADEDCIWLGINSADPQIMASVAKAYGIETEKQSGWIPYPVPKEVLFSTRMHLTQELAAMLLPYLQKFVETGELS